MNEEEQVLDGQEQNALHTPITRAQVATSLASGGMTFTLLDILSHGGAAGAIAGGAIASWVVWRHGGEVIAWVHDTFIAGGTAQLVLPTPRETTHRSWFDRALGRPVLSISESSPDPTPPGTFNAEATDSPNERDVFPPMPEISARSPRAFKSLDTRLHLSTDWHPDIEEIVGLGVVCYGVKGSGKTNTGALLAEQIGARHVPLVVFDLEGDYQSLLEVLPNVYLAGDPSGTGKVPDVDRYLAIDPGNAAEMAQVILGGRPPDDPGGYQVIFQLATYPDDEIRARIMTAITNGLMRYAESLPNDERVPCLIFIDEAAHWFPQNSSMSYLLPTTQNALTRAVFEMVTMGRKRGIIPAFFTQRPADFDKRLAAQADLLILMRQRQDVDIKRYREYLGEHAERAASFGRGQGVVILPDGTSFLTTFYPRQSQHISNTPKAEAAYNRFGGREPVPGAAPTSTVKRRYHFTPAAPGTGGNTLVKPVEQGTQCRGVSEPVPGAAPTSDEYRLTPAQAAEFLKRYQVCGSIRKAIIEMHISYGRYQKHASQLVRAMKEGL